MWWVRIRGVEGGRPAARSTSAQHGRSRRSTEFGYCFRLSASAHNTRRGRRGLCPLGTRSLRKAIALPGNMSSRKVLSCMVALILAAAVSGQGCAPHAFGGHSAQLKMVSHQLRGEVSIADTCDFAVSQFEMLPGGSRPHPLEQTPPPQGGEGAVPLDLIGGLTLGRAPPSLPSRIQRVLVGRKGHVPERHARGKAGCL